jgi:hypothetical protein
LPNKRWRVDPTASVRKLQIDKFQGNLLTEPYNITFSVPI